MDGGLAASTRSGRVRVAGSPRRPWQVTTRSSAIDVSLDADAAFELDATSRSGSVETENLVVLGYAEKGRVTGSVGGGGPTVGLSSRSGSIRLRVVGSPDR